MQRKVNKVVSIPDKPAHANLPVKMVTKATSNDISCALFFVEALNENISTDNLYMNKQLRRWKAADRKTELKI